jgi:hypothetical protein
MSYLHVLTKGGMKMEVEMGLNKYDSFLLGLWYFVLPLCPPLRRGGGGKKMEVENGYK